MLTPKEWLPDCLQAECYLQICSCFLWQSPKEKSVSMTTYPKISTFLLYSFNNFDCFEKHSVQLKNLSYIFIWENFHTYSNKGIFSHVPVIYVMITHWRTKTKTQNLMKGLEILTNTKPRHDKNPYLKYKYILTKFCSQTFF